jgi:hypothetical protein
LTTPNPQKATGLQALPAVTQKSKILWEDVYRHLKHTLSFGAYPLLAFLPPVKTMASRIITGAKKSFSTLARNCTMLGRLGKFWKDAGMFWKDCTWLAIPATAYQTGTIK